MSVVNARWSRWGPCAADRAPRMRWWDGGHGIGAPWFWVGLGCWVDLRVVWLRPVRTATGWTEYWVPATVSYALRTSYTHTPIDRQGPLGLDSAGAQSHDRTSGKGTQRAQAIRILDPARPHRPAAAAAAAADGRAAASVARFDGGCAVGAARGNGRRRCGGEFRVDGGVGAGRTVWG